MKSSFYKLKYRRLVSGVLAGLADKFDISVALLRFLFILFIFSSAFWAVVIYFLLDAILPYKEEEEQVLYGMARVGEKKPNLSMIKRTSHFSKRRPG